MVEQASSINSEISEAPSPRLDDNSSEGELSPIGNNKTPFWVAILVFLILLIGAYFRFTGIEWDDSYHLHPDERFLTDVASQLSSTDPISYLKTSESSLNPYNFGKSFYVYGNFPMTATRLSAELADNFCQSFQSICTQRLVIESGQWICFWQSRQGPQGSLTA